MRRAIPILIAAVAILAFALLRRGPKPPPPRAPVVLEAGQVEKPEPGFAGATAGKEAPIVQEAKRGALEGLLKALRSGNREEIRRANDALFAEIVPEVPPDGENAAVLYKQAFEKMSVFTPEENEALGELEPGATLTSEQRDLVRALLEKNREALALLREAAGRPRCAFPIDYTEGFAALLPHLEPQIRASKLLRAEALLGEPAALPEIARAAFRLADSSANEPILISQLVRNIDHGIAGSVLERTFDGGMSEEALRGWVGAISPGSVGAAYEKSMLFELHGAVELYLSNMDLSVLYGGGDESLRGPIQLSDLTYHAESLSEYADLLRRPHYESGERVAHLLQTRVESAPPDAVLTRLMMPALLRVAQRQGVHEAVMGTAQVAAAVKLHRARYGSYPGGLHELGFTPPVDPFTGRPYLYRRDGAGFVVYSVGTDGLDGGGVSDEEADVVFRSRN